MAFQCDDFLIYKLANQWRVKKDAFDLKLDVPWLINEYIRGHIYHIKRIISLFEMTETNMDKFLESEEKAPFLEDPECLQILQHIHNTKCPDFNTTAEKTNWEHEQILTAYNTINKTHFTLSMVR
jgi:hypothetical protein